MSAGKAPNRRSKKRQQQIAARDSYRIQRVTNAKKAWILCAGFVGFEKFSHLKAPDLVVPDFSEMPENRTTRLYDDLVKDIGELLPNITQEPVRKFDDLCSELANYFDVWEKAKLGSLTICTAQQFETAIGKLTARKWIDIPPYSEMLLQGHIGLAFRHPEFMLASDVEFLFDLLKQCDELCEDAQKKRKPPPHAHTAGMSAQALARTVILTCFNLLEAFANGVGREHLMLHAKRDETLHKKLTDHNKPLRKRIVSYAKIASEDRCKIHFDHPDLVELFDNVKRNRDAFVHCEPGPQTSSRGYNKESAFHDVGTPLVKRCVQLTESIICQIWKSIHGTDRPSWLPDFAKSGKDEERLVLVPQSLPIPGVK